MKAIPLVLLDIHASPESGDFDNKNYFLISTIVCEQLYN